MSDGELLDSVGIPVATTVTSGVETSTSPQRTYYVWKDPPQMAGYNSYPADSSSSPVRHASYASQVGYFLQQQQQQQQQQQPQPVQIQSGGPRTTPSGYPGKPFSFVDFCRFRRFFLSILSIFVRFAST